MTTNETRREIMALAWGLFRADPARTFADALAGAWRWIKGHAARVAANAVWLARAAGRTVAFGSMLQSPIRRRVGNGWSAYKAELTTARVGL